MSQQVEDTRVTDRLWTDLEATLSPGTPNHVMRVLFATDGSDHAEAARRFLGLLPLPPGSAIQVLTVVEGPTWEMPVWYLESGREWGSKTVEQARAGLAREGVEVTGIVRSGALAYEIIQAAEEFDADLLVLGSQGLSGLEAFLLGTVARNVAKHAKCSVLVAREPQHELRRAVLAVDESEHASQAADFVCRLSLPVETEVAVVNVVRPYHPFPGLVPDDPAGFQREVETVRRQLYQAGGELAERARRRLEAVGKRVTTAVQEGDPAVEILKLAAEQEADLLVAGARGVSLIQGLLVGSVADRLLGSARCSILLVR